MESFIVCQLKDFKCNNGICRQGSSGLMHIGGGHLDNVKMLFSQMIQLEIEIRQTDTKSNRFSALTYIITVHLIVFWISMVKPMSNLILKWW